MHIRFESSKVSLTAENQAEELQLQAVFECSELVERERSEVGRVRVSFYIDPD